jgi:hypothetical protein
MKKIPVFFINGILDSGKSTFIIDTLNNDISQDPSLKTLLLVCEQGEVEFSTTFLKHVNAEVRYFDTIDAFDYKLIEKYIKEIKPDRIVMEMNGMWDITKLQFPRIIEIVQTICFIDASTFGVYFNNMRQKFVDMIKRSQIVVFTKMTDKSQIEPYQTALKLINNSCSYFIMDENMTAQNAFEEPLPYDIDAEVITFDDRDYPTFYVDTFEHKERYENKIVEYDTMVFLSDKLPENTFVAGRKIMNCCSNDIQLYGFLVNSKMGMNLKDRSWIHIKAQIKYEYSKEYQEEELVLHPLEINQIDVEKEDVLNLTAN